MSAIAFAVPTIKLLLAAAAFARGDGLEAGAKAFADLLDNATKLDKLLGDLGLRDLAASLTATADQTFAAFTASRAATPAQIADARALFDQCAPRAIPTPDQFATLGLNPAATLAHMETTARKDRDFARDDLAQSLFREVLTPVLAKLLNDPAFTAKIDPALWRQAFVKLGAIKDDTAEILILVRELHQVKQTTVHQDTILAIARKIRPRVETREQALIELESAVDKAAEMEAAGERGSNVDGFVDAVLSRLRTLTRQGALDDAVAEANRAIADCDARIDREQAGLAAVLRAAITQHELAFDAAGAAEKIVRLTLLETSDPAQQFERLLSVQDDYFVRGRDKGLNLGLAISAYVAQLSHSRATTSDERGAALNNLGNALRTLGEREGNVERLEQAIRACSDALQERTRNRVPLDWAVTQTNLGAAFQALGMVERSTARLEQAVQAYRNSLLECTRDQAPLKWAATQANLGSTLAILGQHEGSTARLEQAVQALSSVLLEWTRDRVPLDWAATQNNLGNLLMALGIREGSRERLHQAEQAFRDALQERTRERVPLDWAMTQGNLGNVEIALFDLTADPAHLDWAEAHVKAAREVFVQSGADHYIRMADSQLGSFAARRDKLPQEP